MGYYFVSRAIIINNLESVFSAPPITNPDWSMLDEVIKDNEEVMEAVRAKLPVISSHVSREITEIEIVYITIHVCAAIERKKNKEIAFHVIAACHAGIGTSSLWMWSAPIGGTRYGNPSKGCWSGVILRSGTSMP